jgi:hypothetical protein
MAGCDRLSQPLCSDRQGISVRLSWRIGPCRLVRRIGARVTKLRIHEVAADLGLDSSEVVRLLQEMGQFVKGPSSTIEPPVVRRLRAALGLSARGQHPLPPPIRRRPLEPLPSASTILVSGMESPRDFDAAAVLQADPEAPSSREHGWYSDPVSVPTQPDLLRAIAKADRNIAVLAGQRRALARLGSQLVHVAPAKNPVLGGSTVALVRFSGAIESAFGFTREVMVLYTPYPDLQVRTYEAAFEELRSLKGNVTPDVIFVWSKDRRAKLKLDDWSTPGRLAIPFIFDEEDALGLVALLREHLHVRDLFNETQPVSGATFFGRKTLLQSLRQDVLSQSVSGIFGLRKAGKTSVLYELRESLEADKVVSVLIDLETYPSPPDDPVDDILEDVRRRVLEELRRRDLTVSKLGSLQEYPSILQLKSSLQTLARKLDQDGYRLLIMLDEIEYLTPAGVDIAEGDMPRISQFLAALRSIAQESTNFTFLLSGLTSAILESGRLYGRPNPLFAWAKARYVGPLERAEADRLATNLGARMGIAIDPGALSTLYEASGGHAYLYRNLASTVVTGLPMDEMQRRITRAIVLKQFDSWAVAVRGHVKEMLDHVDRYYPVEGIVMELMRDSPEEIAELVKDEPEAARRLRNLGILHSVDGVDELSVLLDLA